MFFSMFKRHGKEQAALPIVCLSSHLLLLYHLQCKRKCIMVSGLQQVGHRADSAVLIFFKKIFSPTCPVHS
jgi:hypothetical protein